MRSEKLRDALGMVDPRLVERAEKRTAKKRYLKIKWISSIAAVLALAICLGLANGITPPIAPIGSESSPTVIETPTSPSVSTPTASDPTVPDTKPSVTDPAVPDTKPSVTDPAVPDTKPSVTDPTVPGTNPSVTDPAVSDTQPAVTDPVYLPSNPGQTLLSSPSYPKMNQYSTDSLYYKAWRADKENQWAYKGQAVGLESFLQSTVSEFLSGGEGENLVYSPMSVYIALAMLAEVTEGETRDEVLALLGVESITELRVQANAIWNANYSNDGRVTSILGSSVWIDDHLSVNQYTVERLAKSYFASVYRGDLGSDEMNEELRKWLNAQTGGLLKDQVGELELSPQTVFALATTVYFKTQWISQFGDPKQGIFHSPSGDVNCDFLSSVAYNGRLWSGENFTAIRRGLNEGSVKIILPNDGVSVDELLSDPEALGFITSASWENARDVKLHLKIPCFDVQSESDLRPGLIALGVLRCFDPTKADFSGLVERGSMLYVNKVQHGARVILDKNGVEAAAYILIDVPETGFPPEYEDYYFTADRPFIFVITGIDDTPLFVGVVNRP